MNIYIILFLIGVLFDGLGDNLMQSWFTPVDKSQTLRDSIDCITKSDSSSPFVSSYLLLSAGEEIQCTLNETAIYSSIYTDEEFYTFLGKECCTVIDVVYGMSGCEAVVESFYSVVKCHLKAGGQLNDTLVRRAIVDWCLPMPIQCPLTIKAITKLFCEGDKEHGLKKRYDPILLNCPYNVSKVIDRHSSQTIKCPFLLKDTSK